MSILIAFAVIAAMTIYSCIRVARVDKKIEKLERPDLIQYEILNKR